MREYHQDILIVGAGPAGCTAALLLARSGVNVTLIERHTNLDREFRGPAYQPSVVRIWDELEIREEIFSLDHRSFDRLSFVEEGKTLLEMDFTDFPPPYNKIIVLKQAELLRRLIQLAAQYPNFTYIGGIGVTNLHIVDSVVNGVLAEVQGQSVLLTSRLVIGCDGRFSTIRDAAKIPLQQVKQRFDIIWFELPSPEGLEASLQFNLTEHGLLLQLPKEKNTMQVGWVLAKEAYAQFRKRPIEQFREMILQIAPSLRSDLEKYLTDWDKCALLDVKVAMADSWVKDGLLLLGDAAHIASPVGALGNKLAIEDAVIAHPIILGALSRYEGILPADSLIPFETKRRPDIALGLRLQRIVGKVFLEEHSDWFKKIRSWAIPWLQSSPIAKRVRKIIALSPHDVHVDTSWFKKETSRHYHFLTVREIIQETDEAKSFIFDAPDSFSFEPGQFITLRAWIDGRLVKRCYSISSPDHLQITVKKVKHGLFSHYLHEQIKVDDRILSLPPAGTFTTTSENRQYIFLAGGSGITPIMSLVQSILNNQQTAQIALIDVNSTSESIIFKELISRLQEQFSDRFHVTHHLTQEGNNTHPTLEALRSLLETIPKTKLKRVFYLCGPSGLMDTMRYFLKTENVQEEAIFIETFSSLTGLEETLTSKVTEEVGVGISAEKTAESPKQITVTLNGETKSIPYHEDDTLLDAVLREGIDAPFSCKEGICGTCCATLEKGYVTMDKHDALRNQDLKNGKILTCQAKPHSKECTIRYNV